MRLPIAGLGLAILAASPANAQQLESRLAAVRDGTIRLSYATRAEVCGDGRFIGIDTPRGFHMYTFRANGSSIGGYSNEILEDVQPECSKGPMRLVIEKTGGRVTDLRAAVGVAWRRADGVTDIGNVSAPAVATWVLDIVPVLREGLLPVAFVAAVSADSARVADRLLAIARTRTLPAAARGQALRWLTDASVREGKPASADAALRAILGDDTDESGVRDRAIRELDHTPVNETFLRQAYGTITPPTLKDRIIRRMAESGTPENIAWLRALVLDTREPRELRDRALRSLGAEAGRRGEVEALYPKIQDVELKVRALRLMAESGEAASLGRIRTIALTATEPVEVRDRAIRLLAEHRAPSADIAALYDQLTSTQLRQRVVRVLAERGDDAAVDKIAAIAEKDPDPEMRKFAIRRLGETKSPKARAVLERRI